MSFVPLNGLFAHDGVRMPHSPVGESSLSRSMRSGTPPPMMAELISTAKIEVEISGEGCRRTYDRRSKGWNDTLIRELQTMLHSGWYDRQTYRFDTEINNTLCSENAVQKSEGEIHSKCVQSGTLRYESSQLGRIAEDEMPQTCMWIDLQNTNDTRVLRSKEQLSNRDHVQQNMHTSVQRHNRTSCQKRRRNSQKHTTDNHSSKHQDLIQQEPLPQGQTVLVTTSNLTCGMTDPYCMD